MDTSVSASLSSRKLKRACKANQVPSAQQRTKDQMESAEEAEDEDEDDEEDDDDNLVQLRGERGDSGAGGLEDKDEDEDEDEDIGGLDEDGHHHGVAQTACDKGCCVNEIVCAHVCAEARKKGVEIHTLMNPRDTTVGWQAQYAHSVELPSTADIESFKHLREPLWRLPPALRRKAGRHRK
ncbi:hypothetical protein M885DRAFT_572753 [Pelagophyceae sp. CCMP2097]|nr:hypothetical protein M885DRAFT_572753 [Pelagophyceae sp. CCMP2097]